MELQTIPRAYVNVTLQAARLPLTAVERTAHRQDDETWPPALAFDAFEASSREMIGSFLRDDVLVEQGRLGRARVAEIREAVRLEAAAERTKAQADRDFEARIGDDRSKKQENAERAEARKVAADRKRKEAKAETEARARERKADAARVEEDRRKALDKKERAAKSEAIAKERAVVTKAKKAATAKSRSLATDKKLRASKNARRSA